MGQSAPPGRVQMKVRLSSVELAELKALASRDHVPVNQLVCSIIARELAAADSPSGSLPDESAVREMAILIAVELVSSFKRRASLAAALSPDDSSRTRRERPSIGWRRSA